MYPIPIHIIRIYTLIKFGRVRSCVAGTLDLLAEMDQAVVHVFGAVGVVGWWVGVWVKGYAD